jgi:hypothetical protein
MLQLSRTRTLQGPGYGFVSGMTSSLRNSTKRVEVTEPGMTLYVMIPSMVRTGRIKYRCPRTKNLLCTHLLPTKAQPRVLPDVFRLCAASSKNMSMSGRGTSSVMVLCHLILGSWALFFFLGIPHGYEISCK